MQVYLYVYTSVYYIREVSFYLSSCEFTLRKRKERGRGERKRGRCASEQVRWLSPFIANLLNETCAQSPTPTLTLPFDYAFLCSLGAQRASDYYTGGETQWHRAESKCCLGNFIFLALSVNYIRGRERESERERERERAFDCLCEIVSGEGAQRSCEGSTLYFCHANINIDSRIC